MVAVARQSHRPFPWLTTATRHGFFLLLGTVALFLSIVFIVLFPKQPQSRIPLLLRPSKQNKEENGLFPANQQRARGAITTSEEASEIIMAGGDALDELEEAGELDQAEDEESNNYIDINLHVHAPPKIRSKLVQPHEQKEENESKLQIQEHFFQEEENAKRKIPTTIIFTHQTNLLDPVHASVTAATRFLNNIMDTIRLYQKAWKDVTITATTKTRVWFLDNAECQHVLKEIIPKLVPHFLEESRGDFQGDICRAAALYVLGGYYFDVDLRALTPVHLPPSTTFASVLMLDAAMDVPPAFFQAFLASSPRNPILAESLEIMYHYYQSKQQKGDPIPLKHQTAVEYIANFGLLGPFALRAAYEQHSGDDEVLLAEELMNTKESRSKFPNLQYQDHGVGCCCNYVVHNGSHPLFFSRMVGAGRYCERRDASATTLRAPSWKHLPEDIALYHF